MRLRETPEWRHSQDKGPTHEFCFFQFCDVAYLKQWFFFSLEGGSNFDVKFMISIYTKDFRWKKWPKFELPDFYCKFQ
jgi:hypothetical protein